MKRHTEYLEGIKSSMVEDPMNVGDIQEIDRKIQWVNDQLLNLQSGGWEQYIGTLGSDPLHR